MAVRLCDDVHVFIYTFAAYENVTARTARSSSSGSTPTCFRTLSEHSRREGERERKLR